MIRSIGRVTLGALGALLLFASGCQVKQVVIEIPGFDTFQVSGIWLWRLDEATGQYERDGRIEFTRQGTLVDQFQPQFEPGTELIVQVTVAANGERALSVPARVLRDPLDPDRVTLHLHFVRWHGPGTFKASIFNAAGESGLSPGTIDL